MMQYYGEYRGWKIYGNTVTGQAVATKGAAQLLGGNLDDVKAKIDVYEQTHVEPTPDIPPGGGGLLGGGGDQPQPITDPAIIADPDTYQVVPYINGKYKFSLNQWVGPLTRRMLGTTGNMVSLGPVAADYSQYFALGLLVLVNKLTKTPEGLRVLNGMITKYLDNIGEIIKGIHFSSCSNIWSAMINAYTAQPLYERIGLITPKDATQNRIWIDHFFGEILKETNLALLKDSLGGLTTLVNATSSTERGTGQFGERKEYAGLAALAKLYGGG